MKARLVLWLMRLYPRSWRAEYGEELATMLRARPFTARVCSDVVSSALWQRVRAIQAPTWTGLALMLMTVAAIASNIVDAPPHLWAPGQPRYEQPSLPERIELLQRPMRSEFYVLVLAGIGFWTAIRGSQRTGRAAIRVSTIASLPLVAIGLLMMFGVVDFVELNPGQMSTTFEERGIVYTFYKGLQQIPGPAPIVLVLSPLLRLPGAWLWGAVGGRLGRTFADWWRRPVRA
jgi:hypothetical protein